MVGLLLGLLVTGIAGIAFHTAQQAYATTVDHVLLEARGQHALDLIARLIRQSGAPRGTAPATSAPPLAGRDDCGQPAIADLPTCGRRGLARSDALLLRFGADMDDVQPGPSKSIAPAQGSSASLMIDCGGYPLDPAQTIVNLLYIAAGTDGEPQLLCRYPSRRNGRPVESAWTSGALVRGVETLQFRYGVDLRGDRTIDYLRGTEIDAIGPSAWQKVRAVQVALVLRAQRPLAGAAAPTDGMSLPLFPDRPGDDSDVRFIVPARPTVLRRVFLTTVRLRNAGICEETLC
jgi:type IV pilus assembly protein PilW